MGLTLQGETGNGKKLINNNLRVTLPLTKKFWSCHSFVRLLPNRDLPDLTREFFNKEGLSLALSAAKPISFDRSYYLVTQLHSIHSITHNFFSCLQKMNWFLPYKFLSWLPYFFPCNSWIFLQSEKLTQ